jgi:hypothetical protein
LPVGKNGAAGSLDVIRFELLRVWRAEPAVIPAVVQIRNSRKYAPDLAKATFLPEVTLVSGDFVSARILQNENV